MFSGIVKGQATVKKIDRKTNSASFVFEFPEGSLAGIRTGASVSINGVCLTVTEVDHDSGYFDVIQETLEKTNLGELILNQTVNFERSLSFGDEIGGHLTSGHIDCVVEVVAVDKTEENCRVLICVPKNFMRFVMQKGYVALNGASLTVAQVIPETSSFEIALIPETLRITTFGNIKVGSQLNLEIDRQTQAVVETIERLVLEKRELLEQISSKQLA